jgi:DNA-binding NtrC family response regulator
MAPSPVVEPRGDKAHILVASSVSAFRRKLCETLAPENGAIGEAVGGAEALLKLEREGFRALILDCRLDDLDHRELLETIHSRYPQLQVVPVDSKFGSVEGIGGGVQNLRSIADPAVAESRRIEPRQEELFAPANDTGDFPQEPVTAIELPPEAQPLPGMIGSCARMRHLYRLARLVAPRDTTVLIFGGTGTGKELVARGIHQLSRRASNPFVVVNCAAIPETLLEAELFGYTRGAFTGAFQARTGRIHTAHGGTLLLDEVSELPLSMQAKLLRFVQEGEVQRIGSSEMFRVDVRVIAATNANLLKQVRERQFREDLYYRLAVFPIELPPLRRRPEDILPLAHNFLENLCIAASLPPKQFSSQAAAFLRRQTWPGNVRELHHLVERAFVLSENESAISLEHFCPSPLVP